MCPIALSHYIVRNIVQFNCGDSQSVWSNYSPTITIPAVALSGEKLRNRCRRKFYLNSNPRNLKIRRVGRSQLPTQAYVTFVYEFTANCEKKTFLGFTFLKDPIKVVKLWSGWYKRGQHNIYIKAAVIRLTCKSNCVHRNITFVTAVLYDCVWLDTWSR